MKWRLCDEIISAKLRNATNVPRLRGEPQMWERVGSIGWNKRTAIIRHSVSQGGRKEIIDLVCRKNALSHLSFFFFFVYTFVYDLHTLKFEIFLEKFFINMQLLRTFPFEQRTLFCN